MSAILGSYRDEMDACYAADFGRDREPMKSRNRHPEYRRKGGAPTRVSGMHCRRSKRWTWGSGRGARLQNLRAFATAVICAVAGLSGLAAHSAPVTFQYSEVRGANAINALSGFGAVSYDYKISKYEVTNAQYVSFLNTVDPAGTNSLGLYNSGMGTDTLNGGITLNSGAAAGAKYALKTGFRDRPVTYVNWFSAARFVNWMENGYSSDPNLLNTGAYTLPSTATGTAAVSRNPGAQNFLPTASEWTKAAFYSGTGGSYYTYATASNTVPNATITNNLAVTPNKTTPNSANYGRVDPTVTNRVQPVGGYVNTTTHYGLYDTYGNVGEITETSASSGTFVWGGNSWKTNTPRASEWTSATVFSQSVLSAGDSLGFRVAGTVAPVPEPGTIALALSGIAGVGGAGWLKRRRKQAA